VFLGFDVSSVSDVSDGVCAAVKLLCDGVICVSLLF
jgi:hypothetical protein